MCNLVFPPLLHFLNSSFSWKFCRVFYSVNLYLFWSRIHIFSHGLSPKKYRRIHLNSPFFLSILSLFLSCFYTSLYHNKSFLHILLKMHCLKKSHLTLFYSFCLQVLVVSLRPDTFASTAFASLDVARHTSETPSGSPHLLDKPLRVLCAWRSAANFWLPVLGFDWTFESFSSFCFLYFEVFPPNHYYQTSPLLFASL